MLNMYGTLLQVPNKERAAKANVTGDVSVDWASQLNMIAQTSWQPAVSHASHSATSCDQSGGARPSPELVRSANQAQSLLASKSPTWNSQRAGVLPSDAVGACDARTSSDGEDTAVSPWNRKATICLFRKCGSNNPSKSSTCCLRVPYLLRKWSQNGTSVPPNSPLSSCCVSIFTFMRRSTFANLPAIGRSARASKRGTNSCWISCDVHIGTPNPSPS
mmetsp:Transcript_22062/g.50410  ORF Transcript_22062/g.50410 Transcript_22062/m.50410 type:complete len:218 (-) Transcript_22062:81-734(-)